MAVAKKTAAKKPAAKKAAAKKAAGKIYLVYQGDCENGEVFHPRPGTTAAAHIERARIAGPFHTLDEGLKFLVDQENNVPSDSYDEPLEVSMIDNGVLRKITVKGEFKAIVTDKK